MPLKVRDRVRWPAVLAALLLLLAAPGRGHAETRIVVGTGGVTGIYFPAGGAICRLVNARRSEHQVRCSVESTAGSVYNLDQVRAGDLDLGIVQSDFQHEAVTGTGPFEDVGPDENLRALFSLHAEPITLLARAGNGTGALGDLVGKRVNAGPDIAAERRLFDRLITAAGWSADDFAAIGTRLRSRLP